MSIMENTRSFSLIYTFTKDNDWVYFNWVKFVYISERDIQVPSQGSPERRILLLQAIHHDLSLVPLFIFSLVTLFLEISFITMAVAITLKELTLKYFSWASDPYFQLPEKHFCLDVLPTQKTISLSYSFLCLIFTYKSIKIFVFKWIY